MDFVVRILENIFKNKRKANQQKTTNYNIPRNPRVKVPTKKIVGLSQKNEI